MSSKTDICNLALSHIGVGKEIANLETEDSQEASACRRFYDHVRDQMLRDFPWPFATKIKKLALVKEDPDEEWEYSYRYPTDCLKALKILSGIRNDSRQNRVPYKVAYDSDGTLIYSDARDAQLEYIVELDDPFVYPPDFQLAMSFLLATYIAPRLTAGDRYNLRERAFQSYLRHKGMAQANAANEVQRDEVPQSEFIRGRESYDYGSQRTTGLEYYDSGFTIS